MARRESLKKYAKLIQSKGRFGDTELAHINKDEEKLLERYRGGKLSKNPKTGVKEAFPWLAVAGLKAGAKLIGANIKRSQDREIISKQKLQLEEQKKSALADLSKAGQMTGEEASAMAQMKKGAKEGTMDVEGLQQKMSQPLYQQGEAQESAAQAKLTPQGLERSKIAQDVSRKVGSDVRASIADQARTIAYENEKTKADAQRNLQGALMKRGQLLREIAMKKSGVKRASEADLAQLDIQSLMSQQALTGSAFGAVGDIASGWMNQQWVQTESGEWKKRGDN